MTTTLVGLYRTRTAAEETLHALMRHGFPHGALYPAALARNGRLADGSGGVFQRLVTHGVPAGEASLYAEGVSHGGALVVVQTEEDAASSGLAVLNRWHPVRLHGGPLPWHQEDWAPA